MTNLVPVKKSSAQQISLADLQERLDARNAVAEVREGPVSSRKARVAEAKKTFQDDPVQILKVVLESAEALFDMLDTSITEESVPLSQDQINKLSDEWIKLEELKIALEGLEPRYRKIIFSHLDVTGPKIPGRPASQVPGRVEATGPGRRIVFERRGGNRAAPTLDVDGLRAVLPAEVAAKVFVTVHHEAIPAHDEEQFDEGAFGALVESGVIDLDVLAPFLKPGEWRTPTFYKTPVE